MRDLIMVPVMSVATFLAIKAGIFLTVTLY